MMAKKKFEDDLTGGICKPMKGINRDNFLDKIEAYTKIRGCCSMLTANDHPEQLEAWRKYFERKADQRRLEALDRFLKDNGVYATPSNWPSEFDADATVVHR